MAPISIILSDL